MLEESGYSVIGEATDGLTALSAVRRLRPDAVLLDVHLPDMDGFAVAAALELERPAPRVVLTSADEDERVGSQLRRCGALGFVAKAALANARIGSLWERN
jgi:two-component system nitrate/nitrite response regulator NarL